jgi:hypothetical protein
VLQGITSETYRQVESSQLHVCIINGTKDDFILHISSGAREQLDRLDNGHGGRERRVLDEGVAVQAKE